MPQIVTFLQEAESTKQCCAAYKKFIEDYPEYDVDVLLCTFSEKEMEEAGAEFEGAFHG